jgi:hypothetical protein
MKTLDKYVIGAMAYIFGWSLAFFAAWICLGEEPSTLEGCILAPGVVELVCTAVIQRGKVIDKAKPSDDGLEFIDMVDDEEAKG